MSSTSLISQNPSLPKDLISDILSRLPLKSLLSFRTVSKAWNTLITSDSHFLNSHHRHATAAAANNPTVVITRGNQIFHLKPTDPQSLVHLKLPKQLCRNHKVQIFGFCRGIACLYNENDYSVHLWNPATKQSKRLLSLLNEHDDNKYSMGFGFDSYSGDIKFVKVTPYNEPDPEGMSITQKLLRDYSSLKDSLKDPQQITAKQYPIRVSIYSVLADSWREVEILEGVDFSLKYLQFNCIPIFKGVVYWMSVDGVLTTFDLRDELFRATVPFPNVKVRDIVDVMLYKDSVALVNYYDERGYYNPSLWTMDDGNGNGEVTWTKKFTFQVCLEIERYSTSYLRPLRMNRIYSYISATGQFIGKADEERGMLLFKQDELPKIFGIPGCSYDGYHAFDYIGSPVSIKGSNYVQ